jgi:hypothetical protein
MSQCPEAIHPGEREVRMRRTTYYVFHSATVPDLRGITADPDGATLPASGGPWVAERDDPQTLVTARVNDRQILNILADRIGLFPLLRQWLTENRDHTSRVVHSLEGAGAHYRPLSREPLITALKASAFQTAAEKLEHDIAQFETFVSDALLRLPVQLGGGAPKLSARRHKNRSAAPSADTSKSEQPRGDAPLIQGRTRHAWDKI